MLRTEPVRFALTRGRAFAFTLTLLCPLNACTPESETSPALEPEPKPESEPELELALGSGEASFEPAQDGDRLPLYAGTQGGHHIWLSMRVRGFQSDDLRLILDVVPAEPAPPAHTDVQVHFSPVLTAVAGDSAIAAGELTREFVGWPARVLAPECAVGKPVQLSVQLEDDQGHMIKGALEVIADPPALGFASACTL
jgi:hypothetical protein